MVISGRNDRLKVLFWGRVGLRLSQFSLLGQGGIALIALGEGGVALVTMFSLGDGGLALVAIFSVD